MRELLKKTPLKAIVHAYRDARSIRDWKRAGKPCPPPHAVKRQMIARYARQYGIAILVETGTYFGDMIEAQKKRFRQIYSVELAPALYERAVARFAREPHVILFQGDSRDALPRFLPQITAPALFWLDAHASGGEATHAEVVTPIVEELRIILAHPVREHVILIDDARGFDGTNDYPTVDEVKRLVHETRTNWRVFVKDDVIQIHHP